MSSRIIEIPDGAYGGSFYTMPGDIAALYVRLLSSNLKIERHNLVFFEYGKSPVERRRIFYQGAEYQIKLDSEKDTIGSSFIPGSCALVDSEGNTLDVQPVLLPVLINSLISNRHSDNYTFGTKIVGLILDYPERRSSAFIIGDLVNGEFKMLQDSWISNEHLLSDRILGFDMDSLHAVCLNQDLETLWSFKADTMLSSAEYIQGPEVYQDVAIQSFGPGYMSRSPGRVRNGERHADKRHFHDANLYGLDLSDGSVRWHRVIPKSIDNMELIDDRLYICSANEVHVLDAKSGSTLHVVETGLSDDYDRGIGASNIHVEGQYLYFCHPNDGCLLIYNLTDLSLLKRVDIPEPYTIKEFSYCHEATGKLYFELRVLYDREYYHMSPILELDMEDLDGEFEWHNGPPVEVALKQALDNPDHQEVWVTIRDVPLDEAMVYGEMHTQDQAFYHGYQGPARVSVHLTENFNGKVHFRYSGSDRPAEEVREKLQLMEERFTKWANYEAFASTDYSENVTLDAQYLEVSDNHNGSSKLAKDYGQNTPDNHDIESNLMDYMCYLENGNEEYFDDEKFLSKMRTSCLNALEKGESSLAHYLLGIFYMVNSDKENAKKEQLKAAYLGHCVAAIDYANQVDLEDNIEILGIFKAMNDAGERLASMQEDIDYYMRKLSSENRREVENIAEQVKLSIKEKGLKFTW